MIAAAQPLRRPYEALGAGIGAIGVLSQLYFSVQLSLTNGMTFAGAVIQFISFFTILCNIAAAAFYAASLFHWEGWLGRLLRSPASQTAMTIYMTIVGAIYIIILQDTWDPQGVFKVLDITLHYLTPALFLIYWLVFVTKGQTSYRDALLWLVPGLAYVIYALVRGAITGLYPYPFIDMGMIGMMSTLRNVVFLLLFFFVLGAVFVTLDHVLSKQKN